MAAVAAPALGSWEAFYTPIQPKTGSYMKARPKGYRSRETQKIMAENTEAYLTPEDIPCSSVRNGEDISK